jgi:hypothetical protein
MTSLPGWVNYSAPPGGALGEIRAVTSDAGRACAEELIVGAGGRLVNQQAGRVGANRAMRMLVYSFLVLNIVATVINSILYAYRCPLVPKGSIFRQVFEPGRARIFQYFSKFSGLIDDF